MTQTLRETIARYMYAEVGSGQRPDDAENLAHADAILAAVRQALTSPEAVRGIHVANGYDADRLETVPGFLTQDDVTDARAAITAALDAITEPPPESA